MSRIEIRGIIAPSEYDGGWYESLIQRGVITPESKFRNDLAAAAKDEPLTVYLNTPGGSVFAGNEMVNAVQAWKAETGQSVHIIVGAMAASMGAAFVIQSGDRVSVHRNSMLMFHGAYGVQVGGAEAMRDYSDVLAKINAATKATLLGKYKLEGATVDEWFREGREGWLTADEMMAAGIAQAVIGMNDEPMSLESVDLDQAANHGLKIAALAAGLSQIRQEVPGDGGNDAAQGGAGGEADVQPGKEDGHGEGEGSGEGPGDPAGEDQDREQGAALRPGDGGEGGASEAGEGAGVATDAAGPTPERIAGREEGRAEAVSEYQDKVDALKAKLEQAEERLRHRQSESDKLRAELEKARAEHATSLGEMTARLKEATDRLARHLSGGLTFSPAPQTWEEALKACGGVYEKAAKAYPELKRAFNEQNRRR